MLDFLGKTKFSPDNFISLEGSQTKEQRRENRESNRTTTMIISVSLLYFSGNLLESIAPLLEIFGVDIYDDLPAYIILDNVFLFGTHGLYIFIYYVFDKQYNQLFQRLILRRKVLTKMPGTEATESTAQRRSTGVQQLTATSTQEKV